MENKKFCKFCGEQINKESIVCPKCGRQLKIIKEEHEENKEEQTDSIDKNQKFYQKNWFMWVMLFIFAPVGIFFMWKFHPNMKINTKTVITVIFLIFFIAVISINNSETDKKSIIYEKNKQVKVKTIDFNSMKKDEVETWCNDKKINCKITYEYSNNVEKDYFISQSVESNSEIYEGETINIVYSLGRKPTNGEKNALKKAESYVEYMHMSKKGVYNQLVSFIEGFTEEEAQYAIDNINADWNSNALEKAKTYQETMGMSKNAIYNQLISFAEGFTNDEAQYAIDHLDD